MLKLFEGRGDMYTYKLQVLLIAFVSFLFVTSAATAAVPTMEKMYEMLLLQQKEL